MITILVIGIAVGCVFSLIAVGFSIEYRTIGVVNFAQGSYVVFGALCCWWLLEKAGLPYPLAIAGSALITAGIGFLLWNVVVLPLWRRKCPPYVVLLCSIVFSGIMGDISLFLFGSSPETVPSWVPGLTLHIAGSDIDGQYAVVIVGTLILIAAFGSMLRFTTFGRSMRAVAASRETSELLGISAERIGAIAMTITAFIGGLGGTMIAPAQYASVDQGLTFGVFGIIAAVMGGFGSLNGALLGGLVIGVTQALVGRYVAANLVTVFAFGMLLVLLTFRPYGLLSFKWEEGE
jgi:branched-subunit amino acid ABC-type transport system permease component